MTLEDIYWRIRRAIGRGRGVVQDDTGPVQRVQLQLSDLATFDNLPRVVEYGYQSVPPDGWDGIALFFSGDQSSGVVIATNHQQYRVTGLQKGEVCVSDNQGQKIYLKKGGGIVMTDKAGSMIAMNGDGTATITANTKIVGTLEVTQNITADKSVVVTNDVTVSGLSVKSHNHTDPQGGVVGPMQG